MRSQETRNLAVYLKKLGVSLSKVSKGAGVPYMALYTSLFDDSRDRDLRVGEFFAVCRFLGVDPGEFADTRTDGKGT